MIQPITMLQLKCDECGYSADDEEYGGSIQWEESKRLRLGFLQAPGVPHGWTTDGEGKHHCDECPSLELTDDAKAELARLDEATGEALFEVVTP